MKSGRLSIIARVLYFSILLYDFILDNSVATAMRCWEGSLFYEIFNK